MKTLILFFAILVAFAPITQALAHGENMPMEMNGEMMTHEHGSETSFSIAEAVGKTVMDNINVIAIFAFILVVLLSLVLARALYKKEIWKLPHAASFLVILLTVSLVFVLLVVGMDKEQIPQKEYGPGMGPMHMTDFYTGLSFRNAKQIGDFANVEVVEEIVREAADVPPPITRDHSEEVHIELEAKEVISEIDDGIFYYYWTFNGKVPGPTIRVREGDTVVLTLKNDPKSTHGHSIDIHAVTGPGGGAVLTQVKPGESKTMRFKALKPGFYVYHCAADEMGSVSVHIANQMFGGIIVEPKEGFTPVDKEFAVFQGELYTTGEMGEKGFQPFEPIKLLNESPTYFTFNGKPAGLTGEHALKANVGETIRIFFANMGNAKISSFHIVGEILDRVNFGDSRAPSEQAMETATVAAGQGIITELSLEVPGNYVLVDHALSRLDRGAWSILEVEGAPNEEIYSEVK